MVLMALEGIEEKRVQWVSQVTAVLMERLGNPVHKVYQ
jgi:hypothetical protein